MIIGVLRETKPDEYRVALLPVGADLLSRDGHTVLIENEAGSGSGFDDPAYLAAGAHIIDTHAEIYERADLILHVKEPQPPEVSLLRPGQILFCYFHFAASRQLTESCLSRKITAVAYETLRDDHGRLPLLTPMSEVAGKMSIQEGAKYLERPEMGRGILLGGVSGVEPATVLILGAGVVGFNAAKIAAGLGAHIAVMDINLDRLRYLDDVMPANVTTIFSDPHAVDQWIRRADLVIGSVLIPGAKAPRLVSADQVKLMKTGAVIVDVCIDQGGCVQTSRPTTHHEPTYIVDGVVHYCVTNIPGAVGRTSSQALCNATIPYIRQLANLGVDRFINQSPGHRAALNMRDGKITHPAIAELFSDLPHI